MWENHREEYDRYRGIFLGARFPLAFVDLERFDRNVRFVASTQARSGKRVRVHSKSVRCVDLLRRILTVGGHAFRGVMTFTVEEAAFLARRGFDDFIVSYPTVQPSDIRQLVRMTRQGRRVCLMVDCEEHLRALSEAGKQSGVELKACMEVDLSYRPLHTPLHLGVRRSPVRTVDDALALAHVSKRCAGVAITAVMGYEAHIAGPNDARPGERLKNGLVRVLKRASITEFTPRRVGIVDRLRAEGLDIGIVNGGGSGSLVSTARDPSVTEVTAGSAFYAPALFWHYREVSFEPSAFFALQVVRRPAPGIITCHGGGYVASGAAGPDRLPVPVLPQGLRYLPLEGAGEVQTPLELPRGCRSFRLGDPVFFQHAKAGELCERFNAFHLVEGDRLVGKARTYRGDGKAFL